MGRGDAPGKVEGAVYFPDSPHLPLGCGVQ